MLSLEIQERLAIRNLQWLNRKRKNLLANPSKANLILWGQIYRAYKRAKFLTPHLPHGNGNKWKRVLQSKRLEKFYIDSAKRKAEHESFLLDYNR
jgi:hypothetical protein